MSSRNFGVPSPENRTPAVRRRAALCALALAGALAAGCAAPASAEPPSRARVSAIVDTLRADPDLKDTQRSKVLRAKQAKRAAAKPSDASWVTRLLRWVADAFGWIAETIRWLMWSLGALVVALIVVSLRRWIQQRADPEAAVPLAPPSRVGALDVRPETLPDRIGTAARALWLRGERRTALSLLYRGALSRLIHEYRVPIRAAHTEGECLRLAQGRLERDQGAFFARLVGIWLRSVYGARDPEPADVMSLCDEFDRFLVRSSSPEAAR